MTTSLFCWPHRDGFIAREKDSVASVGMTLRGHALKRRLLHKNFFKIKREKQERIAFLLFLFVNDDARYIIAVVLGGKGFR